MQNTFLKEFNEIADKQGSRFPLKIVAQELVRDYHYPIQEMVFIATQYHDKSVAVRIIDDKGSVRTFFLPNSYAEKFRENFEDPKDFKHYQMHLVFTGFRDEKNSFGPLIKFVYLGDAQILDDVEILDSEVD